MKKRVYFLIFLVFIFLVTPKKSFAKQRNYFKWDREEVTIPINSNFESYISSINVSFYYDNNFVTNDVHVELDPFYYGAHTIQTNKIGTKEVILLAYVPGYSNFERKAIMVHIVDNVNPIIKCKKDLNINVNEPFEPSKYFLFTDNDKIDNKSIEYRYNPNDLKIPGYHTIMVFVADVNGNLTSRSFRYLVYDNECPTLTLSSKIELEYGNINYNIYDYVVAFDNFDGDITTSVKTSDIDVFKLGEQSVTFYVEDSFKNITQIDKVISIVDLTAPVLELTKYQDSISIDEVDSINLESYILKVYDNTNCVSIDDVYIDTKDFTKTIGQNEIYFYLKDLAGNYTKRELLLDIRYTSKPEIEANDLSFSTNDTFNLKDYIRITSKYDPNIDKSAIIDDSSLDKTKPGVYEVIIEAMDYAGNETKKSIFVTITDSSNQNSNKIKSLYVTLYDNRFFISIGFIGLITFLIIHFNKKHKKLGE